MNAFPALLLFWGLLPGSRATCTTAYGDKIRYCKAFQTDYIEGIEILIFEERDVGRINSSVFSSASLKSVLSLTLKGSKIHTIESGAFQQFQSLSNMELQDNRLTTLSPSWFHDPATLKNLTVASNEIGRLRPEMLDGFSNLERLNLSRNQITSIHSESLWSLSKMASLDLSYNKISSLQRQTLSPFNGTLRLGGNPWNCSCAHKDFILFLTELVNASRLADPSSVTCRYPPDLMGALVWNVSEMNCSSDTLPPSPEAAFHKVVLPVLFVVLGRQSLPLLLSKPCKGQIPTNPAISSKKTCVSLPNLNVYENNNPSLISANSQYTEPVQDGKENAPEGVSVYNTDLPVMDLSAGSMVSRERLAEALPCKTNLPNEDVLTEDFIRGGEGSYDVSGDLGPNCSDVAPENSAGEWYSTGQDASPCKPDLQVLTIQAQDLVSYDGNSEALPDISAPCGGTLREDEMSQVVSCSNLELPAINLQTEGPITTEIGYSSSSSNLHLPIIDVSAGGNTVAQDDMLVSKVQEQSAVRDKKFIDVSSGLPDVPILRKDRIPNKVDLPTADVQSEGLVISESNPDDDVHCNLGLLAISEEAKTSGECKTMKPRGSQNVKAKSCPILSVMLDNRDRNPSYNRGRLKSKPDSQAIPVVRDPRSNMTTQPDATTFETSQDFPCRPVETMNTSSHESALSTEEQDLSSSGFSDINFPTETQLTPSGSYSISIQDGDEISAWPNTVDILKQSSTISLSSKYDILEASTVPRSKDDSDHCTVLDNGHNAVCSDISTCGADSLGNKSVLQQYDHKDESNKKASCPEERGSLAGEKGMGQNTLHTCSTLEDLSERHSENQMTDAQRPPQHYNMERVAINEHANLKQTSNVEEIVTGKDVEECRKESSDTMIAHKGSEDDARQQFSSVLNRQREDPDEQEDPLKDVSSSSSLATMVQISQHEAPRSEDKMMKSQKNNSVTGNDQGCTSNLDMSYVSHEEDSPIETNQLDDLVGNDCGSADSLTCRQQKPKNNHQETREGDTMKETHNSDSEDQSSLRPNLSRSKDVTAKIRKNIGARKLDANKTLKTAPCIRDIGQDLKDYISTRLSRRPFQSVFPVSEKTRCLEDDSNLNAFTLEEQQFNKVTEITNPANMVASSLRQTNGDPEKSSKMTDAIKYLTYLYARSPRPEMTCGVPIEDTTIDDISVLANLQFCKVSGGFIDDAEVPETVREAAEDPKLTLPKPDILYMPPSKKELKSDEELAVLHVMYTLKKSLELSATCEPDNRTDM